MAALLRRPSQPFLVEVLAAVLTAAGALIFTIEATSHGSSAAIAVLAGAVVCAWALVTPRTGLALVLLLLYLGLGDGYLKLRIGGTAVTAARDVLLAAIVIGLLVREAGAGRRLSLPPLAGWVVAFTVAVLVQVANPHNGTLSHSLQSLRPHLEFVPLFFVGYVVLRSRERLQTFIVLLLAITAVNGVVGVIQTSLTPQQLANWGPGYREKIYGTGIFSNATRGFVDKSGTLRTRPFGLGSDQGFGGALAILAAPFALILFGLRRGPPTALCAALAAGVAIAAATSQARVAILASLVGLAAAALLSAGTRRSLRTFTAIGVTAIVGYAAVSILVANSQSGTFDRYSSISPSHVVSTSVDYRRATASNFVDYLFRYPLGAGLGSLGPAQAVAGLPANALNLDGESEFNYLIVETGLFGLIAFLGLMGTLLVRAVARLPRVRDPDSRLMISAFLASLFGMFASALTGATSATTPGSAFVWLAAGVAAYWLFTPESAEGRASPPAPAR